jgi:hypothetical protein
LAMGKSGSAVVPVEQGTNAADIDRSGSRLTAAYSTHQLHGVC